VSAVLGTLGAVSLGMFVWAVSVDGGGQRRAPPDVPATADPSAPVQVEPREQGEQEVAGAFVFGSDGASQSGWPIGDGILDAVDDALGDCLPVEGKRDGSAVRVIAVKQRAKGPVTYSRVVALEYRTPGAGWVRFYGFTGLEGPGIFDETGARSCSVGWQQPLAELRRTSRFNPQRMHPILRRLMPHQGTDFGAPMGTPVYASYRGVVDWVGPHGSHGNWVSINHPDGIETGYAHLSRFAPGLKRGDRVHAHQLVGYVGSTGRSTGPHLHWSARRDGAYFDAETLLSREGRGVPDADRAAFRTAKAGLDRRLDAIPLPTPKGDAGR
jgi:murein DD-endopeptidase MepM/ murein hydrolase activator NlpD